MDCLFLYQEDRGEDGGEERRREVRKKEREEDRLEERRDRKEVNLSLSSVPFRRDFSCKGVQGWGDPTSLS